MKIILVVLLFGLTIAIASPQSLLDLHNADPSVRMTAFYKMVGSGVPADDASKVALIDLLALEERYITTLTNEDDNYATYYGDVVSAVASLKDPRSLNTLVSLIHTGSIVTDALASFGSASIDPVVARIGDPDPRVTTGAAIVLKTMLSPENRSKVNDPVSLNKIRVGLERVASGGDSIDQSIAAQAQKDLKTIYIAGDLNGDGRVDCEDVHIVRASFEKKALQPGFDPRADVNLDGVVDIRDLSFVSQKLPAGRECQ